MEEFFSREAVSVRVKELGSEIAEFYKGSELTVIALMNGGAFFACDLVREMDIPLYFDSMRISSYVHDQRTTDIKFSGELKLEVKNRHILIADDVFDSGETIRACKEYLLNCGALSVKSAVLVNKKVSNRNSEPDWACFDSPDRYIVGFGLDSEEYYRNLPFVGVLKPEAYM